MTTSNQSWQKKLADYLPTKLGTSDDSNGFAQLQSVSARETLVMMLSALVLGLGGGALAVGLNWSVHTLRHLLHGQDTQWWGIFIPAVGMGAAVFLIRRGIRDFSGHGVSDVIKGMALGSSVLRRRMIFSRFFGSLLTVGSGGSTGLEGPIVCIGGAWGAVIGRWLDLNERRKKLLIGYGVAAAVSGIFNAPLTGLIFTLEIIVGEWTYLTVLPTIIASVSATELSRLMVGNKITFQHELAGFTPVELVACIGLGAITGLVSIAFIRSMPFWEQIFHRLSPKGWVRATYGGLVIGLMGFYFPEVLAEGYDMTKTFLNQSELMTLEFVLLFIILKFVACGVTLGSGGIGGVFAPSLVIGSGVGLAFGMVMQSLSLGLVEHEAAFSLAGMAGMVTAVMHGPLTGIFLVMEATRGYSLILPLMLTAGSAMVVSSYFETGSVYTRELIAQGHLIRRGSDQHLLYNLNIKDILDQDFIPIRDTMLLGEFVGVFKTAHRNYFPVLEEGKDTCVGVVFLDDVRSYLFDTTLYDLVTMGSIMRSLPVIDLSEPIGKALDKFESSKAWSLPVADQERFLGMLSKSTLFDHYRRELQIQSS